VATNRVRTRTQRALVVLAVGLLVAVACAPAATPGAAPGSAKVAAEFKLRGAHNASKDVSFGQAHEKFATCLNDKTNGLVELKIFHSAQLGSDAETLELLQNGALDFAGSTIFANVISLATVFDLPFLFNDYQHWLKAVDGAPGKAITDAGIPKGFRILSFHLGGWRDVYTNKKKLVTVDDFKGLKLRTIQSPAYVQLFQQIGAVPTPLAFGEVYLALQQGTLDGAETALPSMWDVKHYEVSKYVAQTHHGLSSVMWAIATKTWDKLPASAQKAVVDCNRTATDFQRVQHLADAERIDKALQSEKKIEFTKPDPAPFRAAAQVVHEKLVTANDQKALLQQVRDLGK